MKMKNSSLNFSLKIILSITLATILFFIMSINLRYNFTQLHRPVFYDVLHYLPRTAIPTLILFVTLIIALIIFGYSKSELAWILLIPFIYVSEVIANYPNIWARDVYLHGQVWELNLYGHLNRIHYWYPKEYPGFFLSLYEIYRVLDVSDIRATNLFVLYPALIFVLIILIYIVSYRVLRDRTLSFIATIMAFNLLQFNRNELTFVHANTRLYALVLILLIFYALLISKERKWHSIILFIAISTLTISHPLFQLVPPLLLLSLMALDVILRFIKGNRNSKSVSSSSYILISLSILLIWNVYNYYNHVVRIGITSFFDHVYHTTGWELLEASVTIREQIPLIGVVLRNYYKAVIASTTLIAYTYIFKKVIKGTPSYEETVVTALSLAIIFVFLPTVFTASLGNSIDRMLISLPIPISILFIRSLSSILSKIKGNNMGRAVMIMILTYVVVAGYLLVHESPVLQAKTIPLDNVSLFISSNIDVSNNVIATSPFNIYYSCFYPALRIKVVRLDIVEELSSITKDLLDASDIKVVDIRSVIIWAFRYNDLYRALEEFNTFVLIPLNAQHNLVYSNGGYEYVYL